MSAGERAVAGRRTQAEAMTPRCARTCLRRLRPMPGCCSYRGIGQIGVEEILSRRAVAALHQSVHAHHHLRKGKARHGAVCASCQLLG